MAPPPLYSRAPQTSERWRRRRRRRRRSRSRTGKRDLDGVGGDGENANGDFLVIERERVGGQRTEVSVGTGHFAFLLSHVSAMVDLII